MKFKRLLGVSVIVAAMSLLATHDAKGQQALETCGNGCLYTVDGVCVPKRSTYGFHQTHWRKWPYAREAPGSAFKARRPGVTSLPELEVPRPTDESELSPELPGAEVPDVIDEGNRMQPQQLEKDKQVNPFQDDGGLSPMDIDPGRLEELEEFPDTSELRRRSRSTVMNAGYRKPVRESRVDRNTYSDRQRDYFYPIRSANPLRRAPPPMAQPVAYGPEPAADDMGFGRMEVLSANRLDGDSQENRQVQNPLR